MDAFALNDRCIVPWKDGSMYAGRVQKILDPQREVVVQTVNQRKRGKILHVEESTPLARFKNDRHARVSAQALEESLETGRSWFYVHYSGWKQSHDEWIPEERMLPYTPKYVAEMNRVNAELKEREKQARLAHEAAEKEQKLKKAKLKQARAKLDGRTKEAREAKREAKREASLNPDGRAKQDGRIKQESPAAAAAAKPQPKRVRQGSPSEDSLPLAAGIKRRRVATDDALGPEIRISVPLDLKRLLVKDWELVTHSRRIVQLPRPVSVVEIMKDFVAANHDPVATGPNENLQHFADSIVTYFDYALGMMLLYRFERNQYYAQRHPDPANFRASLVYGAEHLARLLVSMPALLAQMSGMDDKTTEYIVQKASALAKFLVDNRARFFAGEKTYDSATRVYEAFSVPDMQGGDIELPEDMNGDAPAARNGDVEATEVA